MDERFSEYDPKVVKVIRTKARELAGTVMCNYGDLYMHYEDLRNYTHDKFECEIMDNMDHNEEISDLAIEYILLACKLLDKHLKKKGEI